MKDVASAKPRKRFFVEMFTRDISLQDCLLDLVDNSIDAFIRHTKLNVLEAIAPGAAKPDRVGRIEMLVSSSLVRISDDCGGIALQKARTEVFNFGHSNAGLAQLTEKGLGAYGIGLKRALFKLGREFCVESHTNTDGFKVEQALGEWLHKDDLIEDWSFPLEELGPSPTPEQAGTTIEVRQIGEELQSLLANAEFQETLRREISRAYAMFLESHVEITLNGQRVIADPIPLADASAETTPAIDSWSDGDVRIVVRVGLATFDQASRWTMDRAGWYIVCNGRVVLRADKTETTGWGGGVLPQFHSSKHRGFVGIAMFYSSNPVSLPWTTTKRGLNRESMTFIRARQRMQSVAKPVYTYLDGLYKQVVDGPPPVTATTARALTSPSSGFFVSEELAAFKAPRARRRRDRTKIQYDVATAELESVRKHLRRSASMSAKEIGRITFDYYLEQEGLT